MAANQKPDPAQTFVEAMALAAESLDPNDAQELGRCVRAYHEWAKGHNHDPMRVFSALIETLLDSTGE